VARGSDLTFSTFIDTGPDRFLARRPLETLSHLCSEHQVYQVDRGPRYRELSTGLAVLFVSASFKTYCPISKAEATHGVLDPGSQQALRPSIIGKPSNRLDLRLPGRS
jgi:hypothetical protein